MKKFIFIALQLFSYFIQVNSFACTCILGSYFLLFLPESATVPDARAFWGSGFLICLGVYILTVVLKKTIRAGENEQKAS